MTHDCQKKAKREYIDRKIKSGWKRFERYVKPEWWEALNDLLEKLKKEDKRL